MSLYRRKLLFIGLLVVVLIALWIVLASNCPRVGIALTSNARTLHRLKNRTALPLASDFDSRITLEELLRQGDDTNRWSNQHAGRIQGQVMDVAYARAEA